MQALEGISIALGAIWANKLRSFLTVLGNIVAVTSIIAVVSIIQGMNTTVVGLIESEGADVVTITRVPPAVLDREAFDKAVRTNPDLTLEDAEALRHAGDALAYVIAQTSGFFNVRYGSKQIDSVQVSAFSGDYPNVLSYDLARGRHFLPAEDDRRRPVALLGWDVAEKLFAGKDPIDAQIAVGGTRFRVIGVADKKGSLFGQSQDEYLIIPIGTFRKLFSGRRGGLRLTIKPRAPDLRERAIEQATLAMRTRHHLRPHDPDDFGITASQTFVQLYESATRGIYTALIGVVSLALVVGGIVIMNIMLMVVTERTREVGVRKALGARRQNILWQFLVEAVTLSMAGGLVGIGLGFLSAYTLSRFTPLPYALEPWSVVLAIGVTVAVGITFGLYPAHRASRLDPIEALRHE